MRSILPILTVLLAIVAVWYAAAVWMNSTWTYDQAARAGVEVTFGEVVADTLAQERPVLPAPHQVAKGLWDGLFGQKVTSKRSLVYHGWITLSATLLGFAIGTVMGIALAVGIVWLAMAQGITLISIARLWTIPTASAMPMTVPMAKPSRVADSVIQP